MKNTPIALGLTLTALLSSCQTHVMPKPLPVFDFRLAEATAVNPPSFYACGDVHVPCAYQPKIFINKEKQRVIISSVQK